MNILDENGYQLLLQEIAKVQTAITAALQGSALGKKSREYTTTAAIDANTLAILHANYGQLCNIRDNCTIIQATEQSAEPMIQTGDVIELTLNNRVMCVSLTSGFGEKPDGTMAVTLNSPAGRAIYGKKVGDTGSYKVDGREFIFTVEKISKQELTSGQGLTQ